MAVVEQPPRGGGDVTFCRTCYCACLHLALLCICDTRALDAMDRDALMARYDLLFMVIVAFYLYDTRCVDERSVLYAWCCGLCTRRAIRGDVIRHHGRPDEEGRKASRSRSI
jgi:hypothetical protein